MKREWILLALAGAFLSCSGGKVDERKLDEAGDKLQKTVEKGADSVGAKLGRLKDKIDSSHADTSRY